MINDIGLITVVVPIYNMGQYLKRAVDSILKQTYKNYEIILVNDGSTDNSLEIANQIIKENPKIKIVSKQNGGLSSARNAGIDNSSGDYIIFPDPDDWVLENYLEVLVNLHLKYKSQLEISGYYIQYDGKKINPHENKTKQLFDKNTALQHLMSSKWFCGFAWNKLYHMDIIKKNNLTFDTELGMAQDLHFAFRYILHCERISFNPIPTYYYFQHIEGVTNVKAPLTQRKVSGFKTYEKLAELSQVDYPEVYNMAKSTLANISMQFLFIYYYTKMNDKEILSLIKNNIKNNFKCFMKNKDYSVPHKVQGLIARFLPKIYYIVRKSRIDGGKV